jgi:trehalose-6-phosphate synthase
MILSEFAGAAQSLNGSIVVNPWDSQQVANAIHEAVTMHPDTRKENHRKLFKVFTRSLLVRNGCSRDFLGST